MKAVQANSIDEACDVIQKMRSWRPFEYSGLKYACNANGSDIWKFYERRPKLKDNCTLYSIN